MEYYKKMIKEKKTKTIQVRLTDEEHTLFQVASLSIGQTPSELVRMFIGTTITQLRLKVQKGEINIEDFKALLNDKL